MVKQHAAVINTSKVASVHPADKKQDEQTVKSKDLLQLTSKCR